MVDQRFEIRQDQSGWTVFDLVTGEAVVILMVSQTGLNETDARDLQKLLDSKAPRSDRDVRQ